MHSPTFTIRTFDRIKSAFYVPECGGLLAGLQVDVGVVSVAGQVPVVVHLQQILKGTVLKFRKLFKPCNKEVMSNQFLQVLTSFDFLFLK